MIKACGCLCGKGHLRKDVSAVGGASAVGPAGPVVAVRQNQAAASMGRGGGGRGGGPSAPASRHTNNNNANANGKGMKPATLGQSPPAAPTTSMTSGVKTTPASGGGGPPAAVLMMNHQHQQMLLRNRANSLSSTGSTASSASSSTANSSGSSSPPMAGGGGGGGSGQQATMPPLGLSTIVGSAPSSLTLSSASSVLNGHGPGVIGTRRRTTSTIDSHHQQLQLHSQPGSTTTDRSGNSGLFLHRADFSAFNALPRHKLNSFHIKVKSSSF